MELTRTAEAPERRREPEPPRPEPVGHARLLLAMQRGAGNQAVARYVAGRRLARVYDIEIENLTLLAQNAGKGKVAGSQIPHIGHKYQVPTGQGGANQEKSYRADDWLNADGRDQQLDDGAEDMMTRARLERVITGWSTDETILEPILKAFVYSEGKSPKTASGRPWYAPNAEDGERVTVPVRGGARANHDENAKLVMHLLSLRAAAHWRMATLETLSGTAIPITKALGAQTETIDAKMNWKALVKASRGQVKALLQGNQVPGKPGTRNQLDNTMLGLLTADTAGGAHLTTAQLVTLNQDGTYKIDTNRTVSGAAKVKYSISDGDASNLHAALNHLRFLVYLEWRAAHDLREAAYDA
jgi:hypothetical protein